MFGAGKLGGTVTRCNNRGTRGNDFVSFSLHGRKCCNTPILFVVFAYFFEVKYLLAIHCFDRVAEAGPQRPAAGRCVTIADPQAGFAHSF
jgi:hypothetical protein